MRFKQIKPKTWRMCWLPRECGECTDIVWMESVFLERFNGLGDWVIQCKNCAPERMCNAGEAMGPK